MTAAPAGGAALLLIGAELARWDATAADALAVGVFEDERPLRGAAGLVDWRLCGRLSRWLQAGRFSGVWGETLLYPPRRKLPFAQLLIQGLGAQAAFDEARFREAVGRARRALWAAGARRAALELPGRATGRIGPRRALELVADQVERDGLGGELLLIESAAGQKEMAEALRLRAAPTGRGGGER